MNLLLHFPRSQRYEFTLSGWQRSIIWLKHGRETLSEIWKKYSGEIGEKIGERNMQIVTDFEDIFAIVNVYQKEIWSKQKIIRWMELPILGTSVSVFLSNLSLPETHHIMVVLTKMGILYGLSNIDFHIKADHLQLLWCVQYANNKSQV